MIINEYKKQYLKHFILSKKNDTPFNFPVNDPDLANNEEFKLYKNDVDSLYMRYAGIKKMSADNSSDLVRLVLSYLKELKDTGLSRKESSETFKKFFLELDYSNITAELQEKVNDGISFLEKKISFFCSYTTKELPDINSSYEEVLVNYFGINKNNPDEFKKWKEINYLAKLIVKFLNERGSHNYFFDRDKLVSGDEIKNEIFDYCERTIAFVILGQQQTFHVGEGTNWCFKEYERYKDSHGDQSFYIVYKIPGIQEPLIGDPGIIKWFKYLTTDQEIVTTTIDFGESKAAIRYKVNKDAEIINERYKSLFSNIVESIN